MPLRTLPFAAPPARPPGYVRRFLRVARRRLDRFQRRHHLPAFVSCDLGPVYGALLALEGSGLLSGTRFCEWGSGMGVVTCLAALVGFDAWGIEAEPDLVAEARRLAEDFDLPVEFARGSFIPGGDAPEADDQEFAWLSTGVRCGFEALGMAPDEFDLVFAYPWPDEQGLVASLFERHARPGALLLSDHGCEGLRLRRKAVAARRPA